MTEGLVLAHYLLDEPDASQTWGGRPVARAEIEEMARYSESIWPTLPTAARARAEWLGRGDTTYTSLDIAWAQWSGPYRGGAQGSRPSSSATKMSPGPRGSSSA